MAKTPKLSETFKLNENPAGKRPWVVVEMDGPFLSYVQAEDFKSAFKAARVDTEDEDISPRELKLGVWQASRDVFALDCSSLQAKQYLSELLIKFMADERFDSYFHLKPGQ